MELELGTLTDCFVDLPSGKRVLATTILYQNGVANSGIIKIPIDQYFLKELDITTLSIAAIKDQYTVTVTDATNFNVGNTLYLLHSDNFYPATVLNKAGNVLTLDSQLTYSFPIVGTIVRSFTKNLNVDGLTIPQTFSIFGPGKAGVTLNVTSLTMVCLTSSPVDLSKFGNITSGLTRGIVLKGVPRPSLNIHPTINWNVKTNADLAGLSPFWTPLSATNPAQGQDGFIWQFKWGGDENHDTAPFLNSGDRIDVVIQDTLTSISSLYMLYSGNLEEVYV